MAPLTPADLAQLAALGITEAEARGQLRRLRRPPGPIDLLRACTVGDGIRRLDGAERDRLAAVGAEAALAGRVSKMVPASGAATRMFRAPLAILAGQQPDQPPLSLNHLRVRAGECAAAANTLRLLESLDRLPFARELSAAAGMGAADPTADPLATLRTLLTDAGLGYAERPKGLIPFHRVVPEAVGEPSAPRSRSAFEEHLVEATHYSRDRQGRCRLHFTVGESHLPAFREHWRAARRRLAADTRFEVSFSTQARSTDTLALDAKGRPLRHPDGSLVLRPGGHGALLGNLEAMAGDLVVVKNIDNVLPERLHPTIALWKSTLIGLAAELQERAFTLAARLQAGEPAAAPEAARFLTEELAATDADALDPSTPEPSALAPEGLAARLERPLRVCGMVANTGEPGGGPFWVHSERYGDAPQIVEMAQIDTQSPHQAQKLAAATHFNPVDLVCAPQNRHGRPYPLADFLDPDTAFVAHKTLNGQPLRALERPGLWNGAMAGWNTVFVEVPIETFAPVKTVLDLLRPEHQT